MNKTNFVEPKQFSTTAFMGAVTLNCRIINKDKEGVYAIFKHLGVDDPEENIAKLKECTGGVPLSALVARDCSYAITRAYQLRDQYTNASMQYKWVAAESGFNSWLEECKKSLGNTVSIGSEEIKACW